MYWRDFYFYNQYSYNLNFRGPVNTFYEHINGVGMSFTLNSGERLSYVGILGMIEFLLCLLHLLL